MNESLDNSGNSHLLHPQLCSPIQNCLDYMPSHHHPPLLPPHTTCCCSASSSSSSSCCCCCCCSNSSSSNPSHNTSDQLLQALANHLLQSQTPSPPPTLYSTSYHHQYLKPQYPLHHSLYQIHHQTDGKQQKQQTQQTQQTQQSLLHSLLRRISSLESSIPHLSSPPHPSASPSHPPKQRKQPSAPPSGAYSSSSLRPSLRDLAARTIQAAFRRFLVRRSQTLRHLKDLATIKSHVAALKSAVSDKTHQEPKVLSQRAMDLLLRLDSVQSGDPMIREGKRSISRELVRILDSIEKVLLREHQLALEAEENGGAFLEDLIREDEGNGGVAWVRSKKVSFLENGNGLRAPCNGHGSLSEESSESEPQGRHEVSDDENSCNASLVEKGGGRYSKDKHLQNGKMGLSAPLPVQMEPRKK